MAELLHMEFTSVGALVGWMRMNKESCDTEEEYYAWLESFFEDGNTVTVGGEEYDIDDCATLV